MESKRLKRDNETPEERRERLDKRNKKDRERRAQKRLGKRPLNEYEELQQNAIKRLRANETPEERRVRLDKRNKKDRERRAQNRLGKRPLTEYDELQQSAEQLTPSKRRRLLTLGKRPLNANEELLQKNTELLTLGKRPHKENEQLQDSATIKRLKRVSESINQRTARLEQHSKYMKLRLASESELERGERLQQLSNNQKTRLSMESEEERLCRLQQLSNNQKTKLSMESEEERLCRLQQLSNNQKTKLSMESEEERLCRLQQLSNNQKTKLSMESEEERLCRLQQLSINQQLRLSCETKSDRSSRLQTLIDNQHIRLLSEAEGLRARRVKKLSINKQHVHKNLTDHFTGHEQHHTKNVLNKFHAEMSALKYSQCVVCMESFPGLKINKNSECLRCSRDKHTPKVYSLSNNMHPGSTPPELQGLSKVEEMLIAAVTPFMCIYRLPHGQLGYRGHVINLPQDITTFVHTLPRTPSDINILLVRKNGCDSSHHDFKVRKYVVLKALQWLIKNNKYYKNIQISHEALHQLPEDGEVTEKFCKIQTENDDEDEIQVLDDENFNDTGSFVPVIAKKLTEKETIRKSFNERLSNSSKHTVPWPNICNKPISEFTTEGYMSMAFPTLFPTGDAEYLAPRQISVTIGNYFKHLLRYGHGQFLKHSRFIYFALNTEMRWRALQAGRIFINKHPKDSRLTLNELRDMVGREGESFSNRVLHFASSLRGTSQYWYKQRSKLISMVDTLGLPTIFFTHSAADTQWPELARLICPDDNHSSLRRSTAIAENPAIADFFFAKRIEAFIDKFYVEILGVVDFWYRFEWQHRGSPHIHGIAWIKDAPDVEKLLSAEEDSDLIDAVEKITSYADHLVCTHNPGIPADGRNPEMAPAPKTKPQHVCNIPYSEVSDYNMDLVDLIATCQRHTRCSTAYCVKKKNGKLQCRFGYPKPIQPVTTITADKDGPVLTTSRNDSLVNSYNPVQLSGWRANVDIQYVVSRRKVVNYVAKYATKSEPRSKPLKSMYSSIMKSLDEDDKSLKVVQKIMISSVGGRDYSAQETCHLLLQLPMFRSSRDFLLLSLDSSREISDKLEEGKVVTIDSQLDHYCSRPATAEFEDLTILQFMERYRVPKHIGREPTRRKNNVIVTIRPYISRDPDGPKYELYCKQKLMINLSFRRVEEILGQFHTHVDAYNQFLQCGNVQVSLAEDILSMEKEERTEKFDYDSAVEDHIEEEDKISSKTQEWMLICRYSATFCENNVKNDEDWSIPGAVYSNLHEMPSFISRQKELYIPNMSTTLADPTHLQGKQLYAYSIVSNHFNTLNEDQPLRMIVSGTAGTGKSYLITCLKSLLGNSLIVTAPTGVAAFNIDGYTLHSMLRLPVKGDFKDLESTTLQTFQQAMANIQYLIIDEMSMVGRKMFGQVDRRLRQAFPHRAEEVFGGCSVILFGDWGQLPPIMDLPLYTTVSRTELSDVGSTDYHLFDTVVVLDQVIRQAGLDCQQKLFRELLLRLRDGMSTIEDWKCLMKMTPAEVGDITAFDDALHLFSTASNVADYNVAKLKESGQPVGTIKAVHSGPGACNALPDEAGGLEATICIANEAKVMLSANLWVDVGLVNGAIGTVKAICYENDSCPPDLPIAVTVHFDKYSGPTLQDGTVPICPIRRSWFSGTHQCSRLQVPLKLAWAVTIHKAQGMTLNKAVIDIGHKEFSSGLTFVACSRVRHLNDLLLTPPFSFQRLSNLKKSSRLTERLQEDSRLITLCSKMNTNSVSKISNKISLKKSPLISTAISQDNNNLNNSTYPYDSEIIVIPHEDCAHLPKKEESAISGAIRHNTVPNDDDVILLTPDQVSERFFYNPVDLEWQLRVCQCMSLSITSSNNITCGGTDIELTPPKTFIPICGDGNCLFRSLSFFITGSEDQHMAVRTCIIEHMRDIEHYLEGRHILSSTQDESSLALYIRSTNMNCDSVWGTDVEILSFAHLSKTPVYIYDEGTKRWHKYGPNSVELSLDESTISSKGIYIHSANSHFQVISSVF